MVIKKILALSILSLALFVGMIANHQANAQTEKKYQGLINPLCPSGTNCTPEKNPEIYDPRVIIGNIIRAALGFIGAIALLLFLYGGSLIMMSQGGEGVKKGRQTMVWAVIGMVIIFSSYYLTTFVIGKLIGR